MERYIGIVIRADYSVAGVTLQRVKNTWSVVASMVGLPGRLPPATELDSVLKFESADKIIIGCDFPRCALIEMNIPPELSNDEAIAMIRFQLGSMIPMSDVEITSHTRRLNRKLPRVEVAAIPNEEWEAMMTHLSEAHYTCDLVTTPLLAANEGVVDSQFYSPEFDAEFHFDTNGMMVLNTGNVPEYTETMQELIAQANQLKKGNGRDKLFPAAIQMALMGSVPITMLTASVSHTMPPVLIPRRNIGMKRVNLFACMITAGLLLALGVRYGTVFMDKMQIMQEQNAQITERLNKVNDEITAITTACKDGEEALRSMGKPNRVFQVFSQIGLFLPMDIYIDNAKVGNDGTIQLTLKGDADVNEFQSSLAQMTSVTVTELNTQTQQSGDRTHNIKLLIKE